MDQMQTALKAIKSQNPQCLNNRQKLKSILSDFLPGHKLQQNLLMNAYDEDIVLKLSSSNDATMSALQVMKTLQNDYGVTPDNAFWAIETWCIIVGKDNVASALQILRPSSQTSVNTTSESTALASPSPKKHLALGIYLAGFDFPAGDIKLEVTSIVKDKQAQSQGVYYAVLKKNSPANAIVSNGFIKTQAVLTLNEGQRLEIGWQGEVDLTSISSR